MDVHIDAYAHVTVLQRRCSRALDEALSRLGLSADQWRALRLLHPNRRLSMNEMSDALAVPAASLTRHMDALVDRALVYRSASGRDRRRVEAALTEAGGRLVDVADEAATAALLPFRDRLLRMIDTHP